MSELVLLADFFKAVQVDPRVNSRHISPYTSFIQCWQTNGAAGDLEVFSSEMMGLCKISASSI